MNYTTLKLILLSLLAIAGHVAYGMEQTDNNKASTEQSDSEQIEALMAHHQIKYFGEALHTFHKHKDPKIIKYMYNKSKAYTRLLPDISQLEWVCEGLYGFEESLPELVTCLLQCMREKGESLAHQGVKGMTALHRLAEHSPAQRSIALEVAKLILDDAGSDAQKLLAIKDDAGLTPQEEAAKLSHVDFVQLLATYPIQPSANTQPQAAEQNQPTSATPAETDKDYRTLLNNLLKAVETNNNDSITQAYEVFKQAENWPFPAGYSPQNYSSYGQAFLLRYAVDKQVPTAILAHIITLIDISIDTILINPTVPNQISALYRAIALGNTDHIKCLLDNGASVGLAELERYEKLLDTNRDAPIILELIKRARENLDASLENINASLGSNDKKILQSRLDELKQINDKLTILQQRLEKLVEQPLPQNNDQSKPKVTSSWSLNSLLKSGYFYSVVGVCVVAAITIYYFWGHNSIPNEQAATEIVEELP